MVKDNGIEVFLDDLASRKPTPSGGSEQWAQRLRARFAISP
jgi:formiminotetrahydrofolate cyclodeaminase